MPWIAEFRDPLSSRLSPGHPHRRRVEALESAIASRAAGVVMPTPTWAAHFGARWGTEVAVLPNGHDISSAPPPPPSPPVLTHVGSFYPGRQSLRPLWQALAQLVGTGSPAVPRIRFVGDLHPDVRAEAAAHGLGEALETTGFVSHDEAMRLLRSSSMLFASGVAGNDPIARGTVPAKLFEYLASGLPVLYLGNPTGDAGTMLSREPGCYVVEPHDIEGVAASLRAGLEGSRYERETSHLSRRAGSASLAAILDRAIP